MILARELRLVYWSRCVGIGTSLRVPPAENEMMIERREVGAGLQPTGTKTLHSRSPGKRQGNMRRIIGRASVVCGALSCVNSFSSHRFFPVSSCTHDSSALTRLQQPHHLLNLSVPGSISLCICLWLTTKKVSCGTGSE